MGPGRHDTLVTWTSGCPPACQASACGADLQPTPLPAPGLHLEGTSHRTALLPGKRPETRLAASRGLWAPARVLLCGGLRGTACPRVCVGLSPGQKGAPHRGLPGGFPEAQPGSAWGVCGPHPKASPGVHHPPDDLEWIPGVNWTEWQALNLRPSPGLSPGPVEDGCSSILLKQHHHAATVSCRKCVRTSQPRPGCRRALLGHWGDRRGPLWTQSCLLGLCT